MPTKIETASERAIRLELVSKAEEYRSKGYEVAWTPSLDFLPGFRPDLVVSKDEEHRVIEVKSRATMLGDEDIVELAKLVNAQPGWSFDLVMISEPEAMATPSEAKSLGVDDINRRLSDAEKMRTTDANEIAFMLAWVACEAAIRELLAAYGVANERITTAAHLLDQAAYHGVISAEDYAHLLDAAKMRNAVFHGYTVDDFDPALIADLISATRNMIDAINNGPLVAEDEDLPDVWPIHKPSNRGDGAVAAIR